MGGSWAYIENQHFHKVHVCMHTPTETYTWTHTFLPHKQYFQTDCSLSTANFPVFIKLPTSKKSDTYNVDFLLISFPECSVIPQGSMSLCSSGSVTWPKVTMRFMAGHKYCEIKPIWSTILSTCEDLGRSQFKDTPVPLSCCQLWAVYRPQWQLKAVML